MRFLLQKSKTENLPWDSLTGKKEDSMTKVNVIEEQAGLFGKMFLQLGKTD